MRKYLLVEDTQDLRDKLFAPRSFKSVQDLPKEVDLRSKMSPVVDQGQLGSCTANAIASGLREYLLLKNGQPLTRLSRLFLYWYERYLEGTVNEDAGAMLRDGMKTLQKIGVAPEADWPYVIGKFTEKPPQKAFDDAKQFAISEYHRILDLKGLKASLAEGLPVVIGIKVYESFESEYTAKTGKVTNPKKGEQLLGGHAMLAVGYKDTSARAGYVIVRNSWGEDWGDKGYCYIPYSVFNKIIMDMWTGH